MKTTPTRTSTLRLLAAVLSLGFATDLCASVVELDTGSLELGGALEADHVIVGSLATLDGDGTVVAHVTIAGTLSGNGFFEGVVNVLSGGRLTPGNSAGTLTVYVYGKVIGTPADVETPLIMVPGKIEPSFDAVMKLLEKPLYGPGGPEMEEQPEAEPTPEAVQAFADSENDVKAPDVEGR
jgi:hypothetical protein